MGLLGEDSAYSRQLSPLLGRDVPEGVARVVHLALEGRMPRQHLIHQDADGPAVRALAVPLP
eukprot:5347581-Pyramimonas_sp.AAC.2